MRKSVYVLAVLVVLSAVLPASAESSPQKPGKWQVKIEMEMAGVPMKLPPVNTTVCLTEEDLKDPQKAVPADVKSDCKVGDYKVDGNKVTWTMECPKQKMKGTGEMTHAGDTYTGLMDMKVGEQAMKMKYSGKWLGTCTK